jgi:hypothetical protein
MARSPYWRPLRASTTAAPTGIRERRTIFSIWDTSPQLHPTTTEADPRAIFNRFGGEGEVGHTHMLWP